MATSDLATRVATADGRLDNVVAGAASARPLAIGFGFSGAGNSRNVVLFAIWFGIEIKA